MTHLEALKKMNDQLLLTAFYAIDTLCIAHSMHADENWNLYEERRQEIRKELNARGLLPEGVGSPTIPHISHFETLWQLARKDLPQ